ncbi:MAG: hypothetical protein Q3M30_01605 [Candidatus Electrothrix sp. Rat3]|nr:hypothetical protein [Candidatus Electrothrix rattekaaiensis]
MKQRQIRELADFRRQAGELVVAEVKLRQIRELTNLRRQGGESFSSQVKLRRPAGLGLFYLLQYFFIHRRLRTSFIDKTGRITLHLPRLPVPFSCN